MSEVLITITKTEYDDLKKKVSRNKKPTKIIPPMLKGEVWQDIPGYENYSISNKGRVRKYDTVTDQYLHIKGSKTRNGTTIIRVYGKKSFMVDIKMNEIFNNQ